jgi:hypothetical protein
MNKCIATVKKVSDGVGYRWRVTVKTPGIAYMAVCATRPEAMDTLESVLIALAMNEARTVIATTGAEVKT